MDDEFYRAEESIKYASAQLGVALLPILEKVVYFLENSVLPALEKFTVWFSSLDDKTQKFILTSAGLLIALSPVLLLFGGIFKVVGSLIKLIPLLGGVFKALGTTVGKSMIGITALATSLYLMYEVIKNWDNMNTIQKIVGILGTLTVAALGAAVAVGAFHSAWSIGLAAAGIVAGVVAVVAAINSAKKDIEGVDIPDYSVSDITSGAASADTNYDTAYGTGGGSGDVIDSNNTTINVTMNATGDLEYDANALADAINKKIIIKKISISIKGVNYEKICTSYFLMKIHKL